MTTLSRISSNSLTYRKRREEVGGEKHVFHGPKECNGQSQYKDYGRCLTLRKKEVVRIDRQWVFSV